MSQTEQSSEVAIVMDQAERQRLVARGVADLHFVNTVLELHVNTVAAGTEPQIDPYEIRFAAPGYVLWPRFKQERGEEPAYNGFCVDEAIPTGGARNLLVYDATEPSTKIHMVYQEFHALTNTVDFEGVNEDYDISLIASRDYYSVLFLARTKAALTASKSSERKQQTWKEESKARQHGVYHQLRYAFGRS